MTPREAPVKEEPCSHSVLMTAGSGARISHRRNASRLYATTEKRIYTGRCERGEMSSEVLLNELLQIQ